jgi:putative effector of murein hydrolase
VNGVLAAALWCSATLLAYLLARRLQRHGGAHWYTLPVVSGTALLLLALGVSGTPYPDYAAATVWLQRLAGPAVVALAVPLYQQMPQWRRRAAPVLAAVLSGCAAALASGWLIGRLLDLPPALLLSLLPRSATMPVAMAAAGRVGGIPALAAIGVVVTGVLGSALVPPVLRRLRCASPEPMALTLGLVAHAIGVAKAQQLVPQALAFAALAMGLMGVATVLALPALLRWL